MKKAAGIFVISIALLPEAALAALGWNGIDKLGANGEYAGNHLTAGS